MTDPTVLDALAALTPAERERFTAQAEAVASSFDGLDSGEGAALTMRSFAAAVSGVKETNV